MKHISTIALWALMMIALPMQAVQNYSCDFETKADRDRWVLNPAANDNIYSQLTNKWYIGAPGNNGQTGSHGLYISDDNGVNAHYTSNACWVVAYDTITLDKLSTNDDYVLSFDYCGMGNVASGKDGIYLMWIPVEDGVPANSIATFASIPSAYENYIIQLQPKAGMDYLGGTQTWKTYIGNIKNKKCDGKPHLLAFVWANTNVQEQQPGAMIDNILILDTRPCDEPKDLKLTIQGTTSIISWTGTATDYEVSAYSYETDTWYGPKTVIGATSTSFSNLPIGQTDFVVRAKCAEGLYSLKTSISKLVYYPDQMCVDYLNLDNATCYINKTSPSSTITFSDFVKVNPVDAGPANIESRHTIHFDKSEREPRTGSVAKTIPDGELASVRLGNWYAQNQAERIEYSFSVDTINYPVLLLKYMPILEAPGHNDGENPRFKLDIRIGNNSIGECGQADFNCNDVYNKTTKQLLPGAEKQGWHLTPKDESQTSADIVWKDWTTVGVNLKNPEYQGKKLTVRLTTHDCTFSAHCGYAYFTLGCSDGKLKGMKCGAINPIFEAPDGFVYSWAYKSSERYRDSLTGLMPEQYILGHDQKYEAGMQDDSVYVVDCMFVQDSTCFFSLYASTLATNPIAVMNEPKIVKNCREGIYQVKFDASPSWVQEIDHVKDDTLVSRVYHIDRYEWNVEGLPGGWSDEVAPTFNFPTSGGDYTVRLTTVCGTCDSTIYYQLHLDSLGPTHETRTIFLCDDARKSGYVWNERPDTLYHTYCTDSVVLYSETTSCDSIIYLNLIEPARVYVDTMVLPETLPFYYRGRSYDHTMIDTIPNEVCDTTWVLNFEVYESILANMPNQAYVLCEGDPVLTLAYDITRGRSLRYSYTFKTAALPSITPVAQVQKKGHYEIPIAIDPKLYPNVYEGSLLLEDSLPKFNVTIPFTVTMQYASTVIAQRWNDVLAIKNADYNGGYVFDSVQWYVSGEPILGATDFVYYTGEGEKLRFGEPYTALLTRNDGVKLFACVYIPTPVAADVQDMPSLVPPSAPMQVKGKGTASWYDMLGRQYSSYSYNDSEIRTPGTEGLYFLVLQNENARTIHRVMVK